MNITLAGTSGTQERRAYGSNVRDLIADEAGQKVTARGLASTLSLMVGTKQLVKTKEPETGRMVLVPAEKRGVDDRNDKAMT